MQFRNAKQVIHDAYNLRQSSSDLAEGGGSRRADSTSIAFSQMKAGLVIKIVEDDLPAHLSCHAKYCFAPEHTCRESEANTLYIKLYGDLLETIDAKSMSYPKIAQLAVLVNKSMIGYRRAVHTSKPVFTKTEMAEALGRAKLGVNITHYTQIIEDILNRYTGLALKPVASLVEKQKAMLNDREMFVLTSRAEELKLSTAGCLQIVNLRTGENHESLSSFTYVEYELLLDYFNSHEKKLQREKKTKLDNFNRKMSESNGEVSH